MSGQKRSTNKLDRQQNHQMTRLQQEKQQGKQTQIQPKEQKDASA
jgi:hypothetical protein